MNNEAALSMNTVEGRWLVCAAHMAQAGKREAQPLYGTAAGREVLGQGAGGDRTLEIDRACETAMHEVLAAEAPVPYRLVSEESGMSGAADALWRVVVDPVDGSLNAKRGLEPFCASIAVADGSSIRDVKVAYIEDYMRPHAFAAVKGMGLVDLIASQSAAGAPPRDVRGPGRPRLIALQPGSRGGGVARSRASRQTSLSLPGSERDGGCG